MRKYEVVHLNRSGDIHEFSRIAPAVPAFEEAFAALARGAILPTENGPVAVEDLLPGDRVRTVDNGFQTLIWRGSCAVVPHAVGQSRAMGHLTRIGADTFGPARPAADLVLGPSARLFHRAPGIRVLTGAEGAFIPARDFYDGVSVVELTPMTAVQVYHLGFAEHQTITANGVAIESYHPGAAPMLGLKGDMLALFLSLFPQVRDLSDFGPSDYRRLRLSDLDLFNAA